MQDDVVTAERPAAARMAQGEWDVRVKLAAACRLVDRGRSGRTRR